MLDGRLGVSKATAGCSIRVNEEGAQFIRREKISVMAKAGDTFKVWKISTPYTILDINDTYVFLTDQEFDVVELSAPVEFVGRSVKLTEVGQQKMRLLGLPADVVGTVTEHLAGCNYYRVEVPEWGRRGYVFLPHEFEVVDEV